MLFRRRRRKRRKASSHGKTAAVKHRAAAKRKKHHAPAKKHATAKPKPKALPKPHPLPKPKAAPKPVKPPPKPRPAPPPSPKPKPSPVPPPPPPVKPVERPVPVFTKPTNVANMERLLWRAGFGPKPGQAEALAKLDLQSAVYSLTRPSGPATLTGPEPHDDHGYPLAPADAWGDDHCFWMDRMVRSNQSLVERMALVFHDWFATSNDGVGQQQLMLDQIQTFRDKAFGTFDDLFTAVTCDPAMLIWLNGTQNNRWNPNENYAREMMELFSLGADRGAYTEDDIRQMARVLTGWRCDWSAELGNHNFRFDPNWHDQTSKTVFGQTGNFDWHDAVRLCVTHPLHASFFCTKLWSYFVPTPPDDATLASLQGVYVSGGRQIRPVVEAILMHPDFYDGPEMMIPPVVYNAGLLRAIGRGIDTTAWVWLGTGAGQQLFYPPNVSGWDDTAWLDTSTIRGRWQIANYVSMNSAIQPWPSSGPGYDPAEDGATAVTRAMAFWGNPTISPDSQQVIADFATTCLPWPIASWNVSPYRAMRQNALRMLIATSPDMQVS